MQSTTPKAAWLVDMAYVVKASAKARFKLDYITAASLLGNRIGETKAYLFNGFDSKLGIPDGLKAFYHAMEAQGMTVSLQPMSGDTSAGTHVQRRVDVDIAAHLVWQASLPSIEHIVLTTGDQDFIPAARIAKKQFGKRLVLFSFERDVSGELRQLADEHLLFESHAKEIAR